MSQKQVFLEQKNFLAHSSIMLSIEYYLNHIDKVDLPHDLYDGHDLHFPAKSPFKSHEPVALHKIEHDKGFSL